MADRHLVERFDPDRLREARTKAGLSQRQLGESIGQERVVVVRYENGRQTPSAPTLIAIAQVLDVAITDLLRPGPVDLPVLRMRRNLSQSDVARALGVSRPWYQRIESRQARIAPALLSKLSSVLEVDEDTLTRLLRVR